MKTYCKNVDITNENFIEEAILSYISDKCKKRNTVNYYAHFSGNKPADILPYMNAHSEFFLVVTEGIAKEMAYHIRNRSVKEHILQRLYGEKVIRYLNITDVGSQKKRNLGLECMILRFYEVLLNAAADPLFKAKIGEYQVASIKGKGQKYGKKAIKKWLSSDPDGTKYGCKADISKCYPSIPHDKLLSMFHRDLGKAPDILYLIDTIVDLYEEFPDPSAKDPTRGILIGSPVSKDMCNYYMSELYHYATERLYKETTRRGKTKRTNLISHIIIYMDDIVIYAPNKRDIQKAMISIVNHARDFLELIVKPNWQKFMSMYRTDQGKERGMLLDFMGFRFHGGMVKTKSYYGKKVRYRKVWVTIRDRTFLKARRKFRRFERKIRRHEVVSDRFAKSLTSYFGCFVQTNSKAVRKEYRIDKVMRIARKVVSNYAKGKDYNTEKYHRMWRSLLA